MVKYRRLSDSELKELEGEFKQFLIANAVYNEDWIKLNKLEPNKAMALVDQFSDAVLEKSLENIKFLIHSSENDLKVFWFQKNKATLVSLECSNEQLNFKHEGWMSNFPDFLKEVKAFTTTKSFKVEDRGKELFQLIKAGALVSSEKMFKMIHQLVKIK